MSIRLIGSVLLGSVAVTAAVLWGAAIPLGVPGEWVWPRIPFSMEFAFGAACALVAGCLYVGFVAWAARGLSDRSKATVGGLVLLLMLAGFGWLWTVQQSFPAPTNLSKGPFVLFYPRSAGYYWQARYEVTSAADFLAGYEELLAERDYLHIGTHPPGLTLGYRGLLSLCESSPGFSEFSLATAPASVRESLETIATMSAQSGRPVSDADQAALWLAMLITLLAAAGTTGGIYVLVRRHFGRSTAWTVAALWPLVPAIAVFHPKSDTLYPFLAVTAAALWLTACDRRSLVRAFLAGCTLWLGMFLSLAFATVGLLLVLMTVWEWWGRAESVEPAEVPAGDWRRRTLLLTAGTVGFGVPTLCLAGFFDLNLINVWRWNVANHALFYEHNTRTWWKWLLVNPLELAIAVGLPIAAVAALSVGRLFNQRQLLTRRAATAIGFLLVWGLLWISGKNMGEAARLWILLMPWVVMSTAPALETGRSEPHAPAANGSMRLAVSPMVLILAVQMIICVLTVQRIDGFHFTELTDTPAISVSE